MENLVFIGKENLVFKGGPGSGRYPKGSGDNPSQKYVPASTLRGFVKENLKELKENGINNMTSAEKVWKDGLYEQSGKNLKEISVKEAVSTIKENINSSNISGWFKNADSDYKPHIEQEILTKEGVRNAALNIAYQNYQENTGSKITYNEFLNKDIKVYRGGNFNFVDNDVFISYSYSKKIAESFGKNVQEITIKPKDTLGSLQTTGECEIMVRNS